MSSEKCLGRINANFDNAYQWTQKWRLKIEHNQVFSNAF